MVLRQAPLGYCGSLVLDERASGLPWPLLPQYMRVAVVFVRFVQRSFYSPGFHDIVLFRDFCIRSKPELGIRDRGGSAKLADFHVTS